MRLYFELYLDLRNTGQLAVFAYTRNTSVEIPLLLKHTTPAGGFNYIQTAFEYSLHKIKHFRKSYHNFYAINNIPTYKKELA